MFELIAGFAANRAASLNMDSWFCGKHELLMLSPLTSGSEENRATDVNTNSLFCYLLQLIKSLTKFK